MVRWRYCLVLAMLLILPVRTGSKTEDRDDDEEEQTVENDEEDGDDDDEEEEDQSENNEPILPRQSQVLTPKVREVTRTSAKMPLECYVCAFKIEAPSRTCLDPTKYRIHTMTCHNTDDKCFTSVISKGNTYEAVVRGCRPNCIGSPDTMCCELNRCNNQALGLPAVIPHVLTADKSESSKAIPLTVLFFVTVLLVLQTVGKVAVV